MNRLDFKKITIQNFLSFGEPEAEFKFTDKGFVLIVGKNKSQQNPFGSSNGAGKTTFVNALFWGLYGETDKKAKKDSIVNNKNKRDTVVKIDFVYDNHKYLIERYRKHFKHQNSLLIFKDNENITQTKTEFTQKIINEIVGDAETFLNSIMFSQELLINFLSLGLIKRKEIAEKIFKLDKLNVYQDDMKEKLNQLNLEINKFKNIENENLAVIKAKQDSIQAIKINSQTKKMAKENKISELDLEIKELEKLDIASIKEIKRIYEEKKSKYDIFVQSWKEKKNLLTSYVREIKEKKRLRTVLDNNKIKVKETLKHPETCPTCGNIINKERFKIFILGKKGDLKNLSSQIKEKGVYLNKLKEKIKLLLEFSRLKFFQLKKELNGIEPQYNKVSKHFGVLEEREKILIEKRNLKNHLENEEEQNDDQLIENIQKEIEKNKREIGKNKKEIEKLQQDIDIFNFLIYSLDIRNDNGIKNHILLSNLPLFNQRLEFYLLSIFENQIKITFNFDFQETIIKDGEIIPYKNLSGGEKKRVDLAINLTLFDLAKSNFVQTNILILDEVLDALDKKGQEVFIDVFKGISTTTEVFLISHSDWIKDFDSEEEIKDAYGNLFSNIIIIDKESGFSKIKVV